MLGEDLLLAVGAVVPAHLQEIPAKPLGRKISGQLSKDDGSAKAPRGKWRQQRCECPKSIAFAWKLNFAKPWRSCGFPRHIDPLCLPGNVQTRGIVKTGGSTIVSLILSVIIKSQHSYTGISRKEVHLRKSKHSTPQNIIRKADFLRLALSQCTQSAHCWNNQKRLSGRGSSEKSGRVLKKEFGSLSVRML